MRDFKIGDIVTVGNECNQIPSRIPYVICRDEDKVWYIDYLGRRCINPNHWKLVQQKQRTIEDVQVGDIIMWGNEKSEVLAVIGELVARTDFMGEKEIHWYTKDRLQEEERKRILDEFAKNFGNLCCKPMSFEEVRNIISKPNI